MIALSDHGTCYGEDGYEYHCISHIYDYKKEYENKAMLSVLPPVSGKEPAKPGTEKNDKQFYVGNYTYSLHIVVAVDSLFR